MNTWRSHGVIIASVCVLARAAAMLTCEARIRPPWTLRILVAWISR